MQCNLYVLLFMQGAFWGLMVGLVVGVCRMVLEFAFPPPRCGVVDSAPAVLRGVHYLHFAILLCGLTAIVVTVVSLLTPPPTHDQVCTHIRTPTACFAVDTPAVLSTKNNPICHISRYTGACVTSKGKHWSFG